MPIGYMLADIGGHHQAAAARRPGQVPATPREGRPGVPAGFHPRSHALRSDPAPHPRRPHDRLARPRRRREHPVPVRRERVHEGRGLRRLPGRSDRLGHPHVSSAGVRGAGRVRDHASRSACSSSGATTWATWAASPRVRWRDSFRAFAKAVQAVADGIERMIEEPRAHGRPRLPRRLHHGTHHHGPLRHAMSDALRGMRGIMLDIISRPDKLLAAQDKMARVELEFAINACKATGRDQGLPAAASRLRRVHVAQAVRDPVLEAVESTSS